MIKINRGIKDFLQFKTYETKRGTPAEFLVLSMYILSEVCYTGRFSAFFEIKKMFTFLRSPEHFNKYLYLLLGSNLQLVYHFVRFQALLDFAFSPFLAAICSNGCYRGLALRDCSIV